MLNSVENFHFRSLEEIRREYTRIENPENPLYYHYTTWDGLKGILQSGGLRATFRKWMNDENEFAYARYLIFEKLKQIEKHTDNGIVESISKYTAQNLANLFASTEEYSSSYCACLTSHSDDANQWKQYSNGGNGFAIGFDLQRILENNAPNVNAGKPFLIPLPVIYEEKLQRELVTKLILAGFNDIKRFATELSNNPEHVTEIRNRATNEIVVQLLVIADFFKDISYSQEKEFRIMIDENNGSLKTDRIKHYLRDEESIPYLFLDLRDTSNNKIPILDIKIGPNVETETGKSYLESILYDLDYDTSNRIISKSSLTLD